MRAMNDVIELITEDAVSSKDEDGYPIPEVLKKETVFASINSVKRSEYYAALREGISTTYSAIVNADDYKASIVLKNGRKYKPNYVIYDGDRFIIIRTYQTDDLTIELTLQEVE